MVVMVRVCERFMSLQEGRHLSHFDLASRI